MYLRFSGEVHFFHYKTEYGSVEEAWQYPDGILEIGVFIETTVEDSLFLFFN